MGTVGTEVFTCVSDHVHRGCRVKGLFPPAGNPAAHELRTTTHSGCVWLLSVYLCLTLPPAGPDYSNGPNWGGFLFMVYLLIPQLGASRLLRGTFFFL